MDASDERDDLTGEVPPLAEPVGNCFAFRERAKIAATFSTQDPVACAMRRDPIRDRTDQYRHGATWIVAPTFDLPSYLPSSALLLSDPIRTSSPA